MLKSLFFVFIVLCTFENSLLLSQPSQLPSLEQITESSLDDQEAPTNDEPAAGAKKPTLVTWCEFQAQRLALTCVLKYYAIKHWITQTVLRTT